MDFPNVDQQDLEDAGKLANTFAKTPLGKMLAKLIGSRYQRMNDRKDKQSTIADEGAKVLIIAEAEAKAEIIRFKTEIDKGELLTDYIRRSGNHLISERIRKDFNLENVFEMTAEQLEAERSSEDKQDEKTVGDDWFTRWTSIAEDVSEEDVQRIWAKVLAGEIKEPGTFSLRSLDVIRNLSKTEAEVFSRLCQFVMNYQGNKFVFSDGNGILPIVKSSIGYQGLKLLEEVGLISSGSTSIIGDQVRLFQNKKANEVTAYVYGNLFISVKVTSDITDEPKTSVISLTRTGHELHSIVAIQPREDYLHEIKRIYASKTPNFMMSVHDIISIDNSAIMYSNPGRIV